MKKILLRLLLSIVILFVLFAAYFVVMVRQDRQAMELKDFYVSRYNASTPVLLPSLFIHGQRFYIKMRTQHGDTLLAFGDSGGGISMMNPNAIDKYGMQAKVKTGLLRGIMPLHYVAFADAVADRSIPEPVLLRDKILRHPFARVTESFLLVPPLDDELKLITKVMAFDIFLGQNFFMGKAWTIDYVRQQIWENTPLAASDAGKPGVQRIGLRRNNNGDAVYGHCSMFIEVDGQIIEVLFDSGASIILSDDGKKALNTTDATIGGSFIAKSIFDKWHHDHPEWKYYPHADVKQDVIEVPKITIGGNEVGPVLFACRPDKVWSEDMLGTMDKVVKGAIGGSALQYLKVTVDYNSALIKFEK